MSRPMTVTAITTAARMSAAKHPPFFRGHRARNAIAAVATIVFRVAGQDTLSSAASMAICLFLVLYWVSFLVLSRKY